ncbi:hypothetical protein [Streptomyces sp. NPDC085540]|uniref:hypothetical protein n=1 Tax=Streptomyces sp. NPDC085540 TaxID=3365730 RepID=UPI0037D89A31
MLVPLLPVAVLGRPLVCRRRLIDGIRWRVRIGARGGICRPNTVRGRRSTVSSVAGSYGVWSAVLTGLQAQADAAGLITWEVNGDSTICRAHQQAAGARRNGQAQKGL